MEKQYQIELNETYSNLVKLKEVQDLNEIRVGQLKSIIDGDQKIKTEFTSEVDILRVHVENLQGEKQELFKMIEQLKSRQAEDVRLYKDRIIELEGGQSAHQERFREMEVELNYEKDYHSKCQYTIKELTDSRDKACYEK